MTNLEMLMNSIDKAKNEELLVLKSGEPEREDFIVVHNEKGYLVRTEDNEVLGCTCPHRMYRKAVCKHMIKVSLEKGMNIKGL